LKRYKPDILQKRVSGAETTGFFDKAQALFFAFTYADDEAC
jgi:hypothetical protein